MSDMAEELIGAPIAFALAQKPYVLESGEHIATLAPLMNLATGEVIPHSASNFPITGYVFWWAVPSGTWQPGDIVVGTIERSRKFGVPDQDWYQFRSNRAPAVRNEVYDSVPITGSHPDGYRWMIDGRHRLRGATAPSADFYVWTNAEVVGPFRAADVKSENGKSSYICTPSDSSSGVVMRYPHTALGGESEQTRRIQSVTISMNDSPPRRHDSVDQVRQYCLIRREDLDQWDTFANPLTLLPDDLIVSRACKRIAGRSKRREAKQQLEALLANVKEDDLASENAIQDGLAEMLSRVAASDAMTDKIIDAIVQSGEFDGRIEAAVGSQIAAAVRSRAAAIEEEAEQAAAVRITELENLGKKIAEQKQEYERISKQLSEAEEQRVEEELRTEELLAAVNRRLQTGRKELLGDLALLGPIFRGCGLNGHIETPSVTGHGSAEEVCLEETLHASQLDQEPSEPPTLVSPTLTEQEFTRRRLWPCLANYGCEVGLRDVDFFHFSMLGSRFLGIPHPGWAAGYADAMGGTATVSMISASPNWLDFKLAFDGELGLAWHRALQDPTRLHLIVLEGIDRCPSHAWLRPWFSILAGWACSLPGDHALGWPDNIRLCATEEKSSACFSIPDEIRQWILWYEPTSSEESPPMPIDGHFPLAAWRLEHPLLGGEAFDEFAKSLKLPGGQPFSRVRVEMAARLRAAIGRFDSDELNRADRIIGKRLFACWSAEPTES